MTPCRSPRPLLSELTRIVPDACCVVGVTKLDQHPAFTLGDFRDALAPKGHIVPVARLDPRVASQVEFLVKALLTVGYGRDSGVSTPLIQ